METVIIVKGASGRGKTPTLNKMVTLLQDTYSAFMLRAIPLNDVSVNDRFVLLDIPTYGKVGIITYGDAGCESQVKKALEMCGDCRAIVAASHTRYYTDHDTVYKILWDYGHQQHAKTVETTTIVKYDNWGAPLEEDALNLICAKNIATILFEL